MIGGARSLAPRGTSFVIGLLIVLETLRVSGHAGVVGDGARVHQSKRPSDVSVELLADESLLRDRLKGFSLNEGDSFGIFSLEGEAELGGEFDSYGSFFTNSAR